MSTKKLVIFRVYVNFPEFFFGYEYGRRNRHRICQVALEWVKNWVHQLFIPHNHPLFMELTIPQSENNFYRWYVYHSQMDSCLLS